MSAVPLPEPRPGTRRRAVYAGFATHSRNKGPQTRRTAMRRISDQTSGRIALRTPPTSRRRCASDTTAGALRRSGSVQVSEECGGIKCGPRALDAHPADGLWLASVMIAASAHPTVAWDRTYYISADTPPMSLYVVFSPAYCIFHLLGLDWNRVVKRWIKPEWLKDRRRKRNHGPGGYPNFSSLSELPERRSLGLIKACFVETRKKL